MNFLTRAALFAPRSRRWSAVIAGTLLLALSSGCSRDESVAGPEAADPAVAASTAAADLSNPAATSPARDLAKGTSSTGNSPSAETPESLFASGDAPNLTERPLAPPESPTTVEKSSSEASPAVAELPRLRADLAPSELIDFLARTDQEMQQIYSGAAGIQNNEEAVTRMRQVGQLKLEAARRLQTHGEANEEQSNEGARGELQALSHLAALGDLPSAEALEALATKNLVAADPGLVTDSQLVLIGFAIESLQHGDADAPERIIELVNGLVNSPTKAEVPTMMVMGQARQMLAQYGYDQQAGVVRQAILDLFADSADPQVAAMAAEIAGSVRFDAIDGLLETALSGGEVTPPEWKTAAEALMDASTDLLTVQYLAGAALEFEAGDRDDLAEATYALLRSRAGDRDDAMGQEVRIALEARESRRSVIGLTFDPDLSQPDGSPLSMADYRGQVVLMPFWASGFPQSLQILPLLRQIRDAAPEDVAIVGMNLDLAGTPLQDFARQNGIDFPSYQSVSSPTAQVVNPVATRFGMVSMPFVVVIDQEGRVVALDFKGQKLKSLVDRLLEP